MKPLIVVGTALLALVALGCGGPIKVTVYGNTGTPYSAPSLCAALLACQNSGKEATCHYEQDIYIDADGKTRESDQCKSIPATQK